MANVVNDTAERIWSVYRSRVPCTPVRDVIGAADVEVAYAVQETNTVRWLKEGRKLSGRKIGLTSKAVQQQLGVDRPDFGMLFADMLFVNGAPFGCTIYAATRRSGDCTGPQRVARSREPQHGGHCQRDGLCGGRDRDRR